MKISIVKSKLAAATAVITSGFYASVALATPAPMSFGSLTNNISNTAGSVWKIVMVIITLAGLLLVVKGLVHLKQNYTGTGQEKHLTKGIASLVFGALLFVVVPVAHVLVGGLGGDNGSAGTYNSWGVNTQGATSLGSYS